MQKILGLTLMILGMYASGTEGIVNLGYTGQQTVSQEIPTVYEGVIPMGFTQGMLDFQAKLAAKSISILEQYNTLSDNARFAVYSYLDRKGQAYIDRLKKIELIKGGRFILLVSVDSIPNPDYIPA